MIDLKIGRGEKNKIIKFIQNGPSDSLFNINGKDCFASNAKVNFVNEVKNNKDKVVGLIISYTNILNMKWFVTATENGISSCRCLSTAVARFPILKKDQKKLLSLLLKKSK